MKKSGKILAIVLAIITVFCAFGIISSTASDADLSVPLVSAKNANGGVYISWTMDFDAEYYNIYRKTGVTNAAKIGKATSYVNYFIDSAAVSGVNYTYYVIPCVGDTEGVCESRVDITYLAQPTDIKAVNTAKGIEISWTKSPSADKYNIYRRLESEKNWDIVGFIGDTDKYLDKTAESGKEYVYTVRARSTTTESAYDENGVSISHLKAPEITKISSTHSGILLNWENVSGADRYVIYRNAENEEPAKLAELSKDTLSYSDNEAEINKVYTYSVCAESGRKLKASSFEKTYKHIPVINVTSLTNATEGVEVKWQASPYATGYKIFRKAQGDSEWTRAGVVKGKNTTSFTDSDVISNKEYTYTVITVSDKYQSSFSNKGMSAKYVAVPYTVEVKANNNGNSVNWTKVIGATDYTVFRRIKGTETWTQLSQTGGALTYQDTTVEKDKVYEYSVRASVTEGASTITSAFSKAASNTDVIPDRKMVAITYDDGPSDSITNWVLDILEENGAKATFFVLGANVNGNSEAMVRAHNMGCEIANHTYNHYDLTECSTDTILSQVNDTNEVIKKYTGVSPVLLRAPGGATNASVSSTVTMPFIYWTVDTRDWEHRDPDSSFEAVKSSVQDGSIILMHDIYDSTAEASEMIIPWLISEGYQLVTVSELMKYRGIELAAGETYYDAFPEEEEAEEPSTPAEEAEAEEDYSEEDYSEEDYSEEDYSEEDYSEEEYSDEQ